MLHSIFLLTCPLAVTSLLHCAAFAVHKASGSKCLVLGVHTLKCIGAVSPSCWQKCIVFDVTGCCKPFALVMLLLLLPCGLIAVVRWSLYAV